MRCRRPGKTNLHHADLIGLEARDSEGRGAGQGRRHLQFRRQRRDRTDPHRRRSASSGLHAETVPYIHIADGYIIVAVPEDDEDNATMSSRRVRG